MTDMTVSRPLIIALLAILAVAAFGLAWVKMDLGRSGDMRSAEADFHARLKSGASSPFSAGYRQPTARDAPASPPATEPDALDAWYADTAGQATASGFADDTDAQPPA